MKGMIIIHGKRSLRLEVCRVLLVVSWVNSAFSARAKHSLTLKVLVWLKAIILLMRSSKIHCTPCTFPFAWLSCIQIIGQRSHMHFRYHCIQTKQASENVRLCLLRYTVLFFLFYVLLYILLSIPFSGGPSWLCSPLEAGRWNQLLPRGTPFRQSRVEIYLSIHWEKKDTPEPVLWLALSTIISLDWS